MSVGACLWDSLMNSQAEKDVLIGNGMQDVSSMAYARLFLYHYRTREVCLSLIPTEDPLDIWSDN